jgi:hypothetical protein
MGKNININIMSFDGVIVLFKMVKLILIICFICNIISSFSHPMAQ